MKMGTEELIASSNSNCNSEKFIGSNNVADADVAVAASTHNIVNSKGDDNAAAAAPKISTVNANTNLTSMQKDKNESSNQSKSECKEDELKPEIKHKSEQAIEQQQKQQQQQQQHLPKVVPPPQIRVVPASQANTVATNAAKKIRRAFTMPRNPFRWSRKFKTETLNQTTTNNGSSSANSRAALNSCVGGGRGRTGSISSLKATSNNNDNDIVAVTTSAGSSAVAIATNSSTNNIKDAVVDKTKESSNENLQMKSDSSKQILNNNSNNNNNSSIHNNNKNTNNTCNNINNNNNNNNNNNIINDNNKNNNNNSNAKTTNRILRRSSFRKFLHRIAQHVSNTVNIGANKQSISIQQQQQQQQQRHNQQQQQQQQLNHTSDRVPPISSGYQWPSDQTPGVMGLKNHGNTCFMNAVLQCLSHTDILAEYFVLDQYKADLKRRNKINSRKFGTKGELTEQLANVLKALWTCKNEGDHSTSFKAVVDRYGSQFRSSTQHDAQEFLYWLLDKVHEDLNAATKRKYKSVKNSYGRSDEIIAAETLANHIRCNNSFVQAVFQAQFRSSLTCPRCKKQSNTFDPFHCISVQLPQVTQQTIFVTVVYLNQSPKQVKLGLQIPSGSPIVALREQLKIDTGIASNRMVLVDINGEGFVRVFYDTQPIETLSDHNNSIYCIEVEEPNQSARDSVKSEDKNEATVKAIDNVKSELNKTEDNVKKTSVDSQQPVELLLLVANVRKKKKSKETSNASETAAAVVNTDAVDTKATTKDEAINETESDDKSRDEVVLERFSVPFSMRIPRECSYVELQKRLLLEMSAMLKPEIISECENQSPVLKDMFQMRLQCPSADPDAYLENVEHPLLTEMIDMALSVLSAEAGPPHIKLVLEWSDPDQYFIDLSDTVIEHESLGRLRDKKKDDMAALTLEQCLEHYTKAETLSAEDAWRCPHCQQYLPVVKTLGLWSLPDILVIHFKRFRQHQEKGSNAAKLTTMVKFPLNAFDMSPHLVRGPHETNTMSLSATAAALEAAAAQHSHYRPSPWRKSKTGNDSRSSTLNSGDNKETRYDLYAVCYHQGDTLETGHYTAACKNPYDHQWYKFDDQRVSKVPNDAIQQEIINNEAYMLFYQRRNNNDNECSASSSNSGSDHWVSRILPPPPVAIVNSSTDQIPSEKLKTKADKVEPSPIVQTLENDDDKDNDDDGDVDRIKEDKTPNNELARVSEKAEATSMPIDIPKVNNIHTDKESRDDFIEIIPEDSKLTQGVVTESKSFAMVTANEQQKQKSPLLDIDKLAYVDDVDIVENLETETKDQDISKLVKTLDGCKSTEAEDEEVEPIFTMEDTNDSAAIQTNENIIVPIVQSPKQSIETTKNMIAEKLCLSPKSSGTGTNSTLTNGYKVIAKENAILTNGHSRLLTKGSSTDSSSSSTSSDLSSNSSPQEQDTSLTSNKINGFVPSAPASKSSSTTSAANYKEILLSSSLKSNSSTRIGAGATTITTAAVVHSNEFQLSRPHYYHHQNPLQRQQQNFYGSRFSVSAVESTTTSRSKDEIQSQVHSLNLRHSFSTSSSCKLRESCNETLSSLLRNSANTCSKDTLLFIDQPTHHHHHNHHSLIEDDDDTFMGSRSLWISPVTPHKLITVSPKN